MILHAHLSRLVLAMSRPRCEWCGDRLRSVSYVDPDTQTVIGSCPRCDGQVHSRPIPDLLSVTGPLPKNSRK